MTSEELGSSTWPDMADRNPVLLVPVGSIEQHGPHLPLDTDTRIAVAIAQRAGARRSDVMVGPALSFGASGEHAGFPGTLSIGTDALQVVLVELARSADGFRGIVFVNGHGGNRDALLGAVAQSRSEGRAVVGWSPSIPGGDSHAGHTETSILLALDPDCVRIDRVETGATGPLDEMIDTLRADGVRSVSANGVLGDPTTAEASDGLRLVAALVDDLAAFLDTEFPA